jgi:hypothetical protein
MDNNTQLNIGQLTPPRQALLTNSLGGHSVQIIGGRFEELSRSSLSKIGLTEIEIISLERYNGVSDGVRRELQIPFILAAASSENNPFKSETRDPDMQRQLVTTNPTLARQLMQEAGVFS